MPVKKEAGNVKPSHEEKKAPYYDPFSDIVGNLLSKVKGKEVFKQYVDHQPFLLSGLDNKEELKSRMAFVDAYKKEFEELQVIVKSVYVEKGEKNEFSYLKNDTFRKFAGENNAYLVDMMKDYMTYKHLLGEVSTANYNSFLGAETDAEKDFRTQKLTKGEQNFLIEASPFSDAKKEGLRECRKWMYRNCAKSGFINETGSKRNYIDSFAKKPVSVQFNTVYQIERGLYKYDDPAGPHERIALSDDYVPKLSGLKDKLNRKKRNPYNLYKKATGDFYYWTRMERALKKCESRTKIIDLRQREVVLEKKLGIKNDDADLTQRKELLNLVSSQREVKRINTALKEFGKARDKYLKCLDKYMKERTREAMKELLDQGNKIQRIVKSPKYRPSLEKIDNLKVGKRPVSSFVGLTITLRQIEKMDDKHITRIRKEKAKEAVDLGLTIKGLGDKAYSAGSGLTNMITVSKTLAKVSKGFSFGSAVSSAYSTVKGAIMSVVSWKRKNKVEEIQKKELKGKEGELKNKDAETRRLNDIAKVSKNRNKLKARNNATEASFAAMSVGFTAVGLAGIVALPLTIAGAMVGGAGFAIKYVLDYYSKKKIANKAIDSRIKTEEAAAKQAGNAPAMAEGGEQAHKKFIDIKVDERTQILEAKKDRFGENQGGRKILDKYLKDKDKIKGRIRDNWAVEKGNISIYSFCDSQDHDNVMEAYRNMFLKDPNGPLDENNLLTPEQVKQFMSTNPNDLKNTRQTEEQARKRAMFKELMKTEGVQTKAPANINEARKMFAVKENQKEKPKERSL